MAAKIGKNIYEYLSIYMYICVCGCVCVYVKVSTVEI